MEWSEGGKWDNCNSIINKYILKKENEFLCKIQFLYHFQQIEAFEDYLNAIEKKELSLTTAMTNDTIFKCNWKI